jgi:hypothetical protein
MSKVYGCTGGYEPRYIEPHPLSMPYAKPFSCAAYLFFYISEIVSFFLVYKCICFVGMLGLEPRAECLDTHTLSSHSVTLKTLMILYGQHGIKCCTKLNSPFSPRVITCIQPDL